MPKEVIPSGGTFDVRLGWKSDGYVQLGVESAEQRSIPWVLYGDEETRAELGRQIATMVRSYAVDKSQPAAAFGEFATPKTSSLPFISDPDLGAEVLNLLDMLASGVPVKTDGELPGYTYMGVWADLNRQGCNELIRHLRRARDAAYGRDE